MRTKYGIKFIDDIPDGDALDAHDVFAMEQFAITNSRVFPEPPEWSDDVRKLATKNTRKNVRSRTNTNPHKKHRVGKP